MASSVDASICGNALNTAQRVAVRSSLSKIRVDQNFSDVKFWGKVMGTQRDYLIAMATVATDKIQKYFFFSADEGLTFSQLPNVDPWVIEKCSVINRVFTGNPSYIYKEPKKGGGEDEGDEDEEQEEENEGDEGEEKDPMDPQWRKLNELERLAFAVQSIENDTCVVPVGARYLTPTGEIQTNNQYKGFSSAASTKLATYLLFRNPQNAKTLARIRGAGVANNLHFLDRISEETTKGLWCIQSNESGQNVNLRNLLWPGFEAKFEVNSTSAVSAYYGYGLKNVDVMFML